MNLELSERRMQANLELSELEAAQGAAVLDGKPFDLAALTAKRAEIDALGAAEAEAVRRERLEAAQAEARRKAALREEMSASIAGYKDALERAGEASKALAGAIADYRVHARDLHRQAYSYGMRVPVSIDPIGADTRLSRLIAGELRAVTSPSRYGVIEWNSVPAPEWSVDFEKYVNPAFAAILEETAQ